MDKNIFISYTCSLYMNQYLYKSIEYEVTMKYHKNQINMYYIVVFFQ